MIISFHLTAPLFGMNDSTMESTNYNHDFILLKKMNLNTFPLKKLGTQKIASIDLSNSLFFNFSARFKPLYSNRSFSILTLLVSNRMIKAMAKEIKEYDLVLIITDTLHTLMYGLFDEIGTNATTALCYLGYDRVC